jgi:coenzyme PQQ precursor peptide PqqA
MEEIMAWTAPKITELSCGMEINRYAPADDSDPILF